MKSNKLLPIGISLSILIFLVQLALPQPVQAIRRGSPAVQGRVLARLPVGYQTLRVGGVGYFRHRGVYYRRGPSGYLVVSAPIGALVARLPLGYTSLVIGGVNYYLAGGVYYQQGPSGYLVVDAPVISAPGIADSAVAESSGAERVLVHVASLNVRSGPGKKHSVLYRVKEGDSLLVTGRAPGWYYVRFASGKFGWVMSKFTRPVDVQMQGFESKLLKE